MRTILIAMTAMLALCSAEAESGWRQASGTGTTNAYVFFAPGSWPHYTVQAVDSYDVTSDLAGTTLAFMSSYLTAPVLGQQWDYTILATVTVTNAANTTNGTITFAGDTRKITNAASGETTIQTKGTTSAAATEIYSATHTTYAFTNLTSANPSGGVATFLGTTNLPVEITIAGSGDSQITATLTITNVATMTNSTISFNADKRTNAVGAASATIITVGADAKTCATNINEGLTSFPSGALETAMGGEAVVTLVAPRNTALALTLSPTTIGSVTYATNVFGSWGTVSYTTNRPSAWVLTVASTNGLVMDAETVIYQTNGVPLFARLTNYFGTASAGNVVLDNNTNWPAGTKLYLVSTNATTPVGVGTVRNSGGVLFMAGSTNALMIRLTGTNAVSINNAVVKTLP